MGVEVYNKNGQVSQKGHGGKGPKDKISKEVYGDSRFHPFPSHSTPYGGYERNQTSKYPKK